MNFKKTTLKNGLKVLTESHPESGCAVAGIFINRGTRHEPKNCVGISHLIEHMVFKGTKDFSSYELARVLEAVGGEVNAFTGREYTCFHTISLAENLDLSVSVLSQLVRHAQFPEVEFEKEKNVILQEILMASDDLEEYVYDVFFENVFGKNSLGWPILGTLESVKGITRQQTLDYFKANYIPENMIVSVAGRVEHDQVVALVEDQLGGDWGGASVLPKIQPPKIKKLAESIYKDCEQYHLIASFPSVSFLDESRFDAYVVNALLGGGMTSRLYQKVREERGCKHAETCASP